MTQCLCQLSLILRIESEMHCLKVLLDVLSIALTYDYVRTHAEIQSMMIY